MPVTAVASALAAMFKSPALKIIDGDGLTLRGDGMSLGHYLSIVMK